MEPQMHNLLKIAQQLDREEPLAAFRSEFYIPLHEDGSEQHYFCGHSLGLQPKSVGRVVQDELDAWRQLGVRGHFEGDLPCSAYTFIYHVLQGAMGGLEHLDSSVCDFGSFSFRPERSYVRQLSLIFDTIWFRFIRRGSLLAFPEMWNGSDIGIEFGR